MMLFLLITLVGILLLLIIGINIYKEQQAKIEAEKRAELSRQRAIISETEDILTSTSLFPCSPEITLMLYTRIHEALSVAAQNSLTPNNDFERRAIDFKNQIETLQKSAKKPVDLEKFRLPDNDKQILQLVKALKKIKLLLKSEQNKGRIDPSIFAKEQNNIKNLQLRINVDSTISKAKSAYLTKQFGTAKQFISKATSILNLIKTQTPDDAFINHKVEEVQKIQDEIEQEQTQKQQDMTNNVHANDAEESGDIDALFQPKKKW